MNRNPFLRAALDAADRGWHVFPVIPGGKIPAIRDWERRATTNKRQIYAWWANNSRKNVGIACGPSNLVVVDLDNDGKTAPVDSKWAGARNGADVLARIAKEAGHEIGETMTIATPTGGKHLYYRAPEGVELRNSAGKLGWHIDVRGHGGFIVGPGSIRPQGRYTVERTGPPALLPGWLTERVVELSTSTVLVLSQDPLGLPDGRAGQYLAKILTSESDRVSSAVKGERRADLLKAARTLGRLVGGHELSYGDAHQALLRAATTHIGVDDFTAHEAETTIADGLEYGARMPRQLRALPGHGQSHDGPAMGVGA